MIPGRTTAIVLALAAGALVALPVVSSAIHPATSPASGVAAAKPTMAPAVPVGATPIVVAPTPDQQELPRTRAAILAQLDPDPGRAAPRLPRVTIDPTGDLTVVFGMKNEPDIDTLRAQAMADTLTILRAIYQSPDASRITTATVIGTFSVTGTKGYTRESPLLRATLTADRARIIGWDSLAVDELPGAVSRWWLSDALAPQDSDALAPTPPTAASTLPEKQKDLYQQVDVMLYHLNQAIFALSGDDVQIARSQFMQFFDLWDNIDEEELQPLYPNRFDQLDLDEQRAENALIHTVPGQEDLSAGHAALDDLRVGLLGVSQDLQAKLKTAPAG